MQLVEEHRAGDPEAMATLLRAYQRRVYSVCYRMVRDPDDAADLTQEALVRVIEGLATYDGRAALSTWVIRVAMNVCLSHLRKQRLRRHGSLDEPAGPIGEPRGATIAGPEELSPPARVEQTETSAVLLRALAGLDPMMRAVLVLRDLQALDYQEIGTVLDVPVGTVKSRLFRARAALRALVEAGLNPARGRDTG
jgi:RNA polymerase sigma-70 factor (ECF subfamily)